MAYGADGALHSIPPNRSTTPYPVHGVGWLQPWQVDRQSQSSTQLSLEHVHGGIYAFRAQYQIIVAADDVSFALEMTNAGRVALPFGLGFHPYFPRRADTKLPIRGKSITTFNAEGLPDHTDDISANDDMRTLTPLAVRGFNHQLNGAYGTHTDQPDDAVSLRMELSDQLSYAHLWVPTGKPFFCIEPLSHPVDAFSHAEQAKEHLLAPGRSMEATMGLVYLD